MNDPHSDTSEGGCGCSGKPAVALGTPSCCSAFLAAQTTLADRRGHQHVKGDACCGSGDTAAEVGDKAKDLVCGMTVDVHDARSKGLATTYEDREYVFCGKGCLLEFRDDPEKYLDPGYEPQGM